MHAADDADILKDAVNADRVCVTLDHDFHAHLAFSKSGRPSVLLLRVERLDAAGQAALMRAVWQSCEVCCGICGDAATPWERTADHGGDGSVPNSPTSHGCTVV